MVLMQCDATNVRLERVFVELSVSWGMASFICCDVMIVFVYVEWNRPSTWGMAGFDVLCSVCLERVPVESSI